MSSSCSSGNPNRKHSSFDIWLPSSHWVYGTSRSFPVSQTTGRGPYEDKDPFIVHLGCKAEDLHDIWAVIDTSIHADNWYGDHQRQPVMSCLYLCCFHDALGTCVVLLEPSLPAYAYSVQPRKTLVTLHPHPNEDTIVSGSTTHTVHTLNLVTGRVGFWDLVAQRPHWTRAYTNEQCTGQKSNVRWATQHRLLMYGQLSPQNWVKKLIFLEQRRLIALAEILLTRGHVLLTTLKCVFYQDTAAVTIPAIWESSHPSSTPISGSRHHVCLSAIQHPEHPVLSVTSRVHPSTASWVWFTSSFQQWMQNLRDTIMDSSYKLPFCVWQMYPTS